MSAPRQPVDRLVVVADDREVAVLRREGPDPQVLRPVRVLVLVDVEVAPALLVPGEDVGRLVEEPDGIEQQVVEVERVRLAQALLVARASRAIVRSRRLAAFSPAGRASRSSPG